MIKISCCAQYDPIHRNSYPVYFPADAASVRITQYGGHPRTLLHHQYRLVLIASAVEYVPMAVIEVVAVVFVISVAEAD
jgi:hypothetical protein